MYCTNCGKEIDDKAVVCVHCGVPTVPISTPSTEPKVPSHEKESYIMNCVAGSLLMWTLFQVIIVFVVSFMFLMVSISSYSPRYSTGYSLNMPGMDTLTNLATLAATIGASLFTVLMFKSMLKIKLPDMHHFHMSFPRILYYTAIAMGISSLASYGVLLLDNLLSLANIHMTTPDFSLQYSISGNLLLILSTCIAAPIFEELLFRGLILTALKRFGNMFAIIITSLLFALVHGNLPQSIPVFFMSLVLCYVALRSKSLLPTIAIHFINNSVAMLFTFMQNMEYMEFFSILLDIILIVFAGIALFRKRKQIRAYIQKHKGTPLLSFFTHWAPIALTLLYLVMIALTFTNIYSL